MLLKPGEADAAKNPPTPALRSGWEKWDGTGYPHGQSGTQEAISQEFGYLMVQVPPSLKTPAQLFFSQGRKGVSQSEDEPWEYRWLENVTSRSHLSTLKISQISPGIQPMITPLTEIIPWVQYWREEETSSVSRNSRRFRSMLVATPDIQMEDVPRSYNAELGIILGLQQCVLHE
ncbi:hypothetical protein B7494_g8400 [Chlorociboria aeruginascens]|nr:hypothetical protein B7494_g8400 [Chlorociboria aeruginascens]